MMAQVTGELGAVVRRSRWRVIGWRPAERSGDPEYEHRTAIETSPAKRVSSIPFISRYSENYRSSLSRILC
jgi:hypothetical protein